MSKVVAIGLLLVAGLAGAHTPTPIAKKDLPAKAKCLVCQDEHGQEKPAGGMMYKGAAYYFCNPSEIKAFKLDPEAMIPQPLPRPMPPLELKAENGVLWNAEAMKGKLVLVDFWATWCKPCLDMMPMIDRVREKYSARGFEVLSVSIDEKRADFDRYLKKRSFPNPVFHDAARTWSKWSVRAIPATFLIKDGKIVAQWKGPMKEKELTAAIEANLGR